MAHFLSYVTHQKIDQRRDQAPPIPTNPSKGVRFLDDFAACIRCVEVVPRRSIKGSNERMTWTGDQDGKITVRSGLLGEEVYTIEKKRSVYVYCLLNYYNTMWAGLSDGYLRVFDVETFELIFEAKLHSAGIACMHQACGFIFTGGLDWQILQWDPLEMRVVKHGQYSGHQNAVRCFASDGSLLFSGGDDYSIRCWDVDLAEEKLSPWPIIGHRGGVRALVIMEVYLFSASTDGCVKVWNTQTGQFVKLLDRREAACTTLMCDESTLRVWSGCADGSISLWNARTLEPVATMADHSGSFVCQLRAITRLNGMKAWSVGENGTVKVWYSETDNTGPAGTDDKAVTQGESERQSQVESMRAQIIQNYTELESRRMQLASMEKIDVDRKKKLAVASANKRVLDDLKRAYYTKILKWFIQRRKCARLLKSAAQQGFSTINNLRSMYYQKLAKFLQSKKERRAKAELGLCLLRSTENQYQRQYLQKLLAYVKLGTAARVRHALVSVSSLYYKSFLLRHYYNTLQRFTQRKRQKKRRDSVVASLQRLNDQTVLSIYWRTIRSYTQGQKLKNHKESKSRALLLCTQTGLLRLYYKRLAAFAKQRINKRLGSAITDSMMVCTELLLKRMAYNKLANYVRWRKTKSQREPKEDLDKRIADTTEILQGLYPLLNNDLEDELRRRSEELAKIEAINADLEAEIIALNAEKRNLKQRLATSAQMDATMNLPDQLKFIANIMKVKSNCHLDILEITAARTAGTEDPSKLFDDGVVKIQKVIAQAVYPEQLYSKDDPSAWSLTPEAMEKIKTSRTRFGTVMEGIVDMVVALDTLNGKAPDDWLNPYAGNKKLEVICNAGPLFDFCLSRQQILANRLTQSLTNTSNNPDKPTSSNNDKKTSKFDKTLPKKSPMTSEEVAVDNEEREESTTQEGSSSPKPPKEPSPEPQQSSDKGSPKDSTKQISPKLNNSKVVGKKGSSSPKPPKEISPEPQQSSDKGSPKLNNPKVVGKKGKT